MNSPGSSFLRGRRAVAPAFLLSFLFLEPAWSQSRMELMPTLLVPGRESHITLRTTTEYQLQGFSLSVRYDPEILDFEAVDLTGRVLETVEPDYVLFTADPRTSSVVVGVLVEATPPFEDRRIPGAGTPLDLLDFVVMVHEDAEADSTSLRFVDGLGDPAISNRFVVENQSIAPEQLGDVELEILDRGIVISERPFVRGDVNQDRHLDMSDPVMLLHFLFLGFGHVFCPDAADVNDDEELDISDCVYLLGFLYVGTEAPLLPYPDKGLDRSGNGALGCPWSIYPPF